MENLNSNEMKVLAAFAENSSGNGYAFGWSDELEVEGLSPKQISGYISQLSQKRFIYCWDDPEFPGQTTFEEDFVTYINGHSDWGREIDGEKLEEWLCNNKDGFNCGEVK